MSINITTLLNIAQSLKESLWFWVEQLTCKFCLFSLSSSSSSLLFEFLKISIFNSCYMDQWTKLWVFVTCFWPKGVCMSKKTNHSWVQVISTNQYNTHDMEDLCWRWFSKRFLHPDVVEPYEYIFIWDEDLGVSNFDPLKWVAFILLSLISHSWFSYCNEWTIHSYIREN